MTTTTERPAPGLENETSNIFSRALLFIRQVFAELSKVVTPTRRELVASTATVLAFVAAMMVLIAIFDTAFGTAAIGLFTGPSS